MLKILQARLQQCVNQEVPVVQAVFRKGRGNKRPNCQHFWSIEKEREFQENIYFCFIDYAKGFDCVYHNKLWHILKEMGIPEHITCVLRNLYIGQEAKTDTFLEFPCFLYNPANVGNLISGSSVFSKPNLYIWKVLVHILLKPSLKDFEHYLTSMGNECNCPVV